MTFAFVAGRGPPPSASSLPVVSPNIAASLVVDDPGPTTFPVPVAVTVIAGVVVPFATVQPVTHVTIVTVPLPVPPPETQVQGIDTVQVWVVLSVRLK